ncbi:MAG: hypothetical protein F6K50_23110 [Moorea sp. SIO3I7]|uniref:hypothetical protein n=1 Tax=unclassified Moorena TaxID=2683338 RepID=UPI0013BF43BC|nr:MULTISPECIES: hypothetical protein [unclassified Moorena]NEN98300.1 hypothetical protein [Moorena sp. SIO3I7]NEO05130.1 hypothetical protein [Moorena sp. SIO3I8]NEO11456.1 hypothetical protein [Moorena sp. SIO3E8]NEO18930.1 hypothetical protein [Moorena sp. SIO4A5]NEP21057.1 hypothetical protein [Moorena sp. SIO3I6]
MWEVWEVWEVWVDGGKPQYRTASLRKQTVKPYPPTPLLREPFNLNQDQLIYRY